MAAETTEFEEFVCTAPERLATTAFWGAPRDELLAKLGFKPVGEAASIVEFAFDVWCELVLDTAADTIGGDLPRLDDLFE